MRRWSHWVKNDDGSAALEFITIGVILLVIIALHVVGALKHKFIDKDETMKRMSLK